MEELDRLESGRGRSLPLRVGVPVAAAAVIATLVAISWSWHPGRHGSTPPATGAASDTVRGARPGPAASARRVPGDIGSVFVQPLPDCLRTDHQHTLRIAMAIQNLADQQLQLESVDVIGRIPGLTLTGQEVGERPCADRPRAGGRRLRSAAELVVGLEFTLDATCPPSVPVTARLGFVAGTTILHAETANLVDLSSLSLRQCG